VGAFFFCCAVPYGPDIVEELKEKGIAELSDGAMCVFIEGSEVPLIVQKSDGGFGYAATDMAALKQRVTQEKADWVIYVVDIGQSQHFELVFAAARRAGYLPPKGSSEVSCAAEQPFPIGAWGTDVLSDAGPPQQQHTPLLRTPLM
jgi:arginyl-tRNA synthetase